MNDLFYLRAHFVNSMRNHRDPRPATFAENRLLSVPSLSRALLPLNSAPAGRGVSSAFHYTGTDALNAVAQLELYEEDATGRVLLEARRGPSTLGASVSQTGAIHVAAVSRHVTRRAFFLGS